MKKIQKINELCRSLFEYSDTIQIGGNDVNKKELIDYIRTKHEPKAITLQDALDVVRNRDLFQEVKRVLVDKDNSFNY